MNRLRALLLALAAGLFFSAAATESAVGPKGTASQASWSGASAPELWVLKGSGPATVSVPPILLPNSATALSLAGERSQAFLLCRRSETPAAISLFARPPPVSRQPYTS